MRWEYDRETGQILALSPKEVKSLGRELRPIINSLQKKYDYFKDIHESGEATERQQSIMVEYEDRLNFLISLADKANLER